MRLFVGTILSESILDFYDRFIHELVHPHRELLRAIPERTAHLTYAFCSAADDRAVEAIIRAVKQSAETHRSFAIALGSPHVVSAGRRPRLVCAEILSGQAELGRLTADLLTRLQLVCPDLPLSPSKAPHVTLARFRKQAKRSDAQSVSLSLGAGPGAGAGANDRIMHLQIVGSTLTPSGPVYAIRSEVPLKGTETAAETR